MDSIQDRIQKEMSTLFHGKPEPQVIETALLKNARKLRQAVEKARQEMRLSGLPSSEKDRIICELELAARTDLSGLIEQEAARIAETVDNLKKRYDRDAQVNRAQYQQMTADYARKVSAMTYQEVAREAQEAYTGRMRPEQLDILSIAIKQADPKEHEIFRELLAKERLYEPWLHTDEGRQLSRYQAVIDVTRKDDGSIPILRDDGSTFAVSFDHLEA